MKWTKKQYVMAGVLALAAVCVLWRFTPRSFESMIAHDAAEVKELSCSVTIYDVIFDGGHTHPDMKNYQIKNFLPEDAGFQEILGRLEKTGYRPALRNLLPWPITTVGAEDIRYAANVSLAFGDGSEDYCYISFHGDRLVSVSLPEEEGFRIYYPADRTVLSALVDCAQRYGQPVT